MAIVLLIVGSKLTFGALLDADRDMTNGRVDLWNFDLTTSLEEDVAPLCKFLKRLIIGEGGGSEDREY